MFCRNIAISSVKFKQIRCNYVYHKDLCSIQAKLSFLDLFCKATLFLLVGLRYFPLKTYVGVGGTKIKIKSQYSLIWGSNDMMRNTDARRKYQDLRKYFKKLYNKVVWLCFSAILHEITTK